MADMKQSQKAAMTVLGALLGVPTGYFGYKVLDRIMAREPRVNG